MPNKKVGLSVLFLSLLAGNLFAQSFANYTVGDVLLCFQKSGVVNDLVVDLGPISTFTNASANQRISITQYAGNQLALVGTNGVNWSAFTWFDTTVTPSSLQWTLFASAPRPSLNTQSSPYPQATASSQHLAANKMAAVPKGAYDQAVAFTNNALSTYTAAIEPDNNGDSHYITGQSYSYSMGPAFDFNGTFGGSPTNVTPSNFTLAHTVQRSDFYMIPPRTSGLGEVYLGYFELNTNGVMTYVAYPTATPAAPVIQSITRANSISYVTFTTGSSGTYSLQGTNNLTVPRAGWPVISSAPGNGSTVTLQDTNAAANMYYFISAQ